MSISSTVGCLAMDCPTQISATTNHGFTSASKVCRKTIHTSFACATWVSKANCIKWGYDQCSELYRLMINGEDAPGRFNGEWTKKILPSKSPGHTHSLTMTQTQRQSTLHGPTRILLKNHLSKHRNWLKNSRIIRLCTSIEKYLRIVAKRDRWKWSLSPVKKAWRTRESS